VRLFLSYLTEHKLLLATDTLLVSTVIVTITYMLMILLTKEYNAFQ